MTNVELEKLEALAKRATAIARPLEIGDDFDFEYIASPNVEEIEK